MILSILSFTVKSTPTNSLFLTTNTQKFIAATETHLQEINNENLAEGVHHLRRDIKAIKAFLDLSHSIDRQEYEAPELKKMYKKAGKIRTIQIARKISESLSLPLKIEKKLGRKEKKLSKKYLNNLPDFRRNLRSFRDRLALPEIKNWNGVHRYLRKELNIDKTKISQFGPDEFHTLRKRIKRVLSICNTLPSKVRRQLPLNVSKLDDMQHEIGEWHDLYVTYYLLSQSDSFEKYSSDIVKIQAEEKKEFVKLAESISLSSAFSDI